MQLALPTTAPETKRRFNLPAALPPFNRWTYWLFSAVWTVAFLLAVVGPVMGLYDRYTSPRNNSQLLLGSRAGFAVSPADATSVRFVVGPQAAAAGMRAGDHILAVYGLPLPAIMPVTEQVLAAHADDPAYIAMGNVLFGTDNSDVPLTVRGRDGRVRDVTVSTGEQHIDAAARAIGMPPKLLSFIDLLPVLSYPFLLCAAWILHRRNSRDAVSSILSLAVLLTIGAEQPSAMFLAQIGVSRWMNVALFDLGNMLLLAGILLFPYGKLSWTTLGLLASLPLLMLLEGEPYQAFFICFMVIAILSLLRTMRGAASDDVRQQIRWALFGFAAYAALRGISITADTMKWSTINFRQQVLAEMVAGVSFGIGTLALQLGLLVALLKYRLYDADSIIGRTISVAIVTLVISGGFGGVMEGITTGMQFIYPESDTSQMLAAMAGAIFAASCIEPVRDRAREWTERKFQKNLFLLKEDLPESVRDLRETASFDEMLEEILSQVDRGVRGVRAAMIVNGCVVKVRGISEAEVEAWRTSIFAKDYKTDICEASDRVFPLRVPLIPSSDREEPIGYLLVGPRPDNSVPTREEQRALKEVSEGIARAIRSVIKREAREAELESLIEENARRIEMLESLLNGGTAKSRQAPRSA